jgi:aminoacrylate hydrolase
VSVDVLESDRAGAPTVLFSAGLGGAAGYWSPQLGALHERFRVVTYDQAGTGRNKRELPRDHSIAAMAEEALHVIEVGGGQPVHFVGHALGGLIGLELALAYPDRVASLTIVNGWAAVSDHTRRCFDMRLTLLKHEGPAAYARAQPIFLFPADWLTRNAERAAREEAHGLAHFQGETTLRRRIGALLAFDARARLTHLTTPCLIVAARDDVLVPSQMSELLANQLPNARLHLAPWGGHALNVTEPDKFNAVLLDFLDSVAA